MFTYGDGISNVNLKKLLSFHKKNKKTVTVTAVHPPARFGEIILKKNIVTSFKEKPQVKDGWINGGFFVANYQFLITSKAIKISWKKSLLKNYQKIKISRHLNITIFGNVWIILEIEMSLKSNLFKKQF